jgi:hypothetical protein
MAVVYKDGVFRNVKNGNEEVLEVLTVQSAQIAGSTSTIIGAVTGRKIRIISGLYLSSGIASCNVKSNSLVLGHGSVIANIPFLLELNPVGWYETTAGEALVVDTFTNTMIYDYRYIVYEP